MIKNLKKEVLEKQHTIVDLKNQLVEAQVIFKLVFTRHIYFLKKLLIVRFLVKVQYDQNLVVLQGKIDSIQEESMKMKEELEKKKAVAASHAPKCKRKGKSCDPPSILSRNFRTELSTKEKEIQQLNKQVEELKKANRKLLKDKENYYLSSKEQSFGKLNTCVCNKLHFYAND